jgi:hypothetical protein
VAGRRSVQSVSDDTKTIAEIAQNSGWFFTAITAAWGFVLRWMLGRHVKAMDRIDAKLTNIDARLSTIEGRMVERDRGRRS